MQVMIQADPNEKRKYIQKNNKYVLYTAILSDYFI